MGTSGGGKTTIVNLVERFYDPHRGSVLFDGLPLTDIDHDYLHQQVQQLLTECDSHACTCSMLITLCTVIQHTARLKVASISEALSGVG